MPSRGRRRRSHLLHRSTAIRHRPSGTQWRMSCLHCRTWVFLEMIRLPHRRLSVIPGLRSLSIDIVRKARHGLMPDLCHRWALVGTTMDTMKLMAMKVTTAPLIVITMVHLSSITMSREWRAGYDSCTGRTTKMNCTFPPTI